MQFAITTGLTLLILPYARQAARMNRIPPEFRSNRHLAIKRHRPDSAHPPVSSATSAEQSIGPDIGEGEGNFRDTDGPGEPMGGLMAFKAFGIATAVVLGSAGLGAWGVAKFLGVKDVSLSLFPSFTNLAADNVKMEEFSLKMREKMEIGMPGLTTGMRKYGAEPDELGDFLDEMGREPGEAELERPTGMPS